MLDEIDILYLGSHRALDADLCNKLVQYHLTLLMDGTEVSEMAQNCILFQHNYINLPLNEYYFLLVFVVPVL